MKKAEIIKNGNVMLKATVLEEPLKQYKRTSKQDEDETVTVLLMRPVISHEEFGILIKNKPELKPDLIKLAKTIDRTRQIIDSALSEFKTKKH